MQLLSAHRGHSAGQARQLKVHRANFSESLEGALLSSRDVRARSRRMLAPADEPPGLSPKERLR